LPDFQILCLFFKEKGNQNSAGPSLIRAVSAYFTGNKRLLPNSALITPRMHGFMAEMAKANDVRPMNRAPGHQTNFEGGE